MDIKNEVPILPNDLMRMIFREFSDKDRIPIGTSCKRFRAIDFDIGRRTFAEIKVVLDTKCRFIKGILKIFPKFMEYSVGQEYLTADGWCAHYKNLFRHAKTTVLDITVKNEEAAPCIQDMFRTVSYDELRFKFDGNLDVSAFIIALLKDRKLDHSTFHMRWNSDITHENADRMRETFLKIPKTFRLLLFKSDNEKNECGWINDENLLHLVANTSVLRIGTNNCSALGILRAFEYVCEVQQRSKIVVFYADKAVVDEFFSMNHTRFDTKGSPGRRRLMHRSSGAILFENLYFIPRKMFCEGTQMMEKVVNVEQWYLTIKTVELQYT